MPARDREGAVRMLDPGHVPLPPDLVEFHRERVGERARGEGRTMDYTLVIDDVFSMSRPSIPAPVG
jgi:methylaspartate mutase epsilon subunit